MALSPRIRVITIGIVRREDDLFVCDYDNPATGEHFYRPLGGGVEFGERSADALRREFREEIGAEITDLVYLGMMENLFTFEGRPGHEIVLLYGARFADPAWYRRESVVGDEDGAAFTAGWRPLAAVRAGQVPLYPDGLLAVLDGVAVPGTPAE